LALPSIPQDTNYTTFSCKQMRWPTIGPQINATFQICKVEHFWMSGKYLAHMDPNKPSDIKFPFEIYMPNMWSIRLANISSSWFQQGNLFYYSYPNDVPVFLFANCLPNAWFILRGCGPIMYHALKAWDLLDKNVKLVMINDYPLNPPSELAKTMYESLLRPALSPYPIDYLNDPQIKNIRFHFPTAYMGVNSLIVNALPRDASINREYINYVINKTSIQSGRELRYQPEKPVVTFAIRTKNRRFLNLSDMIAVAKELGVAIRVIEFAANQSFADQIHMLQNTSVFVSAHGQQLTYMMFMNPNSTIFEFFYKYGSTFQETYRMLAMQLGLNYYRPLVENGSFAFTLKEWCPKDDNTTIARCLQHPSHQCNKNCNDYWSKSGDLTVDIPQFKILLQKAIRSEPSLCKAYPFVRPSNNLTFNSLQCL